MKKYSQDKLDGVSTFELDKIKTEYMLYEASDLPKSVEEARGLMDVFVDDMDSSIKMSQWEKIKNHLIHEFGLAENMFLRFMCCEEDDLGYLDEDLGFIIDEGVLSDSFKGYFILMRENLLDDNFSQLSRLAMFVKKKFLDNYNHLESLRDSIACRCLGLYCKGTGEETRMAVEDLFKEEFAAITTKGIEKVKKM